MSFAELVEDAPFAVLAIVEETAAAHGWDVLVGESETGGARFEFVTAGDNPE